MLWYVGRFHRHLGLIVWTDVPETYEPAQAHDNDLFSARTIQFAKQRMSHCSRSHPTCSSSAFLPLWVIEISDNGLAAKLVPGSSRVARYVTLSYRWGEVTRYTMTTANRSSLQQGIPLDQPPKTFSDAIELTHKLGYKYLWIDALCITQDDSRELGEQIAAMQDVYSGSDLTLFAGHGVNANSGLNRTRDATVIYPLQVEVRAELPFLRNTFSKTPWIADALGYADPDNLPLFQRGWVFQEQLLSRRGLVFNREWVSWRCLRDNVSEILPFDRKVSGEEFGYIPEYLCDGDGLTKSRNWFWAKSTDDFYKADFPLESYYRSIELYMRRTLTFESDRLRAISGLMAMTEQRTGSKFYYGTCLQDTRGFLWRSNIRKNRPNGSSVAPSWAWASCLGYFGHFLDAKSFHHTWQVAEHHNTRDRGGLEIVSWTQWGTVQTYTQPWGHLSHYFIPKRGGYYQYENHRLYLDGDQSLDKNEFTDGRPLLCIFIANDETEDYALLTEPCRGEEDTFVRIGLARYPLHEMFNVLEAVKRRGAVMNSQRNDDNPQRTIQYLI
jgi:hypothetical protein